MTIPSKQPFLKSRIVKRVLVFVMACFIALGGFYATLKLSAKPISHEEREKVDRAIAILDDRGFAREAWFLRYLTAYRSNDNWLNASVEKENAYAATNFPFEIMTLYPLFFSAPVDDTERAAILLHEARHLEGGDEKAAYEFVWKNRKQLGWTSDKYRDSEIWNIVRQRTSEYAPYLFNCDFKEFGDCTE